MATPPAPMLCVLLGAARMRGTRPGGFAGGGVSCGAFNPVHPAWRGFGWSFAYMAYVLIGAAPAAGLYGAGHPEECAPDDPDESASHNPALCVLGAMVLWFGWYGFNGASTLGRASSGDAFRATLVCVHITLAPSVAGLILLRSYVFSPRCFGVVATRYGILGGLARITAGCAFVEPGESIVFGLRSGAGILHNVGADLAGKVEAGIDEDDPHNPVIADVGDNVGDVAGMDADLFEAYVGPVIAAATLGAGHPNTMLLPSWIASIGVLCSTAGFSAVSTKEEGRGWDVQLGTLMFALEKGMYVSAGLFVILAATLCFVMFNTSFGWKVYGCIILGLVAGAAIGKATEYFTSFDFGPAISIKDRARTGPATVGIQGIGVGMSSTVPPAVNMVVAIVACNELAGNYGVAIAAEGMLATLGITPATDAYGPVADNAGGLAEMAGLGEGVRAKTDSLDVLGNTTAATGKGSAIGSAVLTSLSLLAAFKANAGKGMNFDVSDSIVLSGVLSGAMLPYLFAALTMISVGKTAAEIIDEVRRQFREAMQPTKPGISLRSCIERALGLELSDLQEQEEGEEEEEEKEGNAEQEKDLVWLLACVWSCSPRVSHSGQRARAEKEKEKDKEKDKEKEKEKEKKAPLITGNLNLHG